MGRTPGTSHIVKINRQFSHPICRETSSGSSKFKNKPLPNTTIKRNGCSYIPIIRNENSRTSQPRGEFHISNFSYSQKRRYRTSHIQPKELKSIYNESKVPFNQYSQSQQFYSTGGLACENRSLKRIFPFVCKSQPQEVSQSNLQSKALSNHVSTIWPGLCAQNIRLVNELGITDLKRARDPDNRVLGRFFNSTSKPSGLTITNKRSSSNTGISWVANKLQKVDYCSSNINRVFGNSLESTSKHKISTSREMFTIARQNCRFNQNEESLLEANSKHSRVSKFRQFYRPQRTVTPPPATKTLSALATPKSAISLCDPRPCIERTGVVEKSGSINITTALSASDKLPSNGRVGDCLGSPTEQCETIRPVVKSGIEMSFQSEGIVSHLLCPKRPRSLPSQFNSHDTKRQQDSCNLFKKGGRDKIGTAYESNLRHFRNIGEIQYPYSSPLYTGSLQPRSRSSLSLNFDTRMAPPVGNNKRHFQQVGNTANRPFCISNCSCSPHICNARLERSKFRFPRCVQQNLELSPRVGVSSTFPNTASSTTSELGNGNLPDSRAPLDKSILETRPQKSFTGSPIHSPQTRQSINRRFNGSSSTQSLRNDFRSMALYGWSDSLLGWSHEQIEQLLKCWRPSSINTYQIAWKKWQAWATQNRVELKNPKGSDFAKFLIDLHIKQKLSYRTILVYKSAISSLCDPSTENRLSSHFLVKQALRSLSNSHTPASIKKAPIWDTDIVVTWLRNNSPNSNNLYECSARAAILLLLCSGRRVHDLTLLMINEENCTVTEDYIIFWPKFGSKTDNSKNRQSGWRLLKNKENRNFDPLFWIKQVIKLSEGRRQKCNVYNLFITACGNPKVASRTVIAGWVKKSLEKAGINASPGSIRPAVASKNWIQNYPLDEILCRGNWRSENTFMKYYCREIKRAATSHHSISNLFSPIS